MRTILKSAILFFVFLIFLTTIAVAQPPLISIPVTASDNHGNHMTIYFGRDPRGSICRDSVLGEKDYNFGGPVPPFFDMGWIAPHVTPCYSGKRLYDYRGMIDATIDTFIIVLWPGNPDTVTLSWPNLSGSSYGTVTATYTSHNPLGIPYFVSLDMMKTNVRVFLPYEFPNSNYLKITIAAWHQPGPTPIFSPVGFFTCGIALILLGVYLVRRRMKTT